MTLAEQCTQQIERDIVQGVLAPGERLKLDVLKSRYNAGFSPLREALSRLAASGLVELEGNKGFRVVPLRESEISDLYQTFCQIELLALRQSIASGDAQWEGEVVGALHRLKLLETAVELVTFADWSKENTSFHRILVAGCGSPTLLEVREGLYRRFERFVALAFLANPEPLAFNHAEHKAIAEAALSRQADKAARLLEAHILGAESTVLGRMREHYAVT